MKKRRRISAPVKRFACAGAGVLMLFALISASGHVERALEAKTHADGVLSGVDARQVLEAESAEDVLARIEDMLSVSNGGLSDAFQREIGIVAGGRDVRMASNGLVVGYVCAGEAESVMEELADHMAERGWTRVPLGGVCGATFMKGEGAFTWVLVTCTQVGDVTSVVIRSAA